MRRPGGSRRAFPGWLAALALLTAAGCPAASAAAGGDLAWSAPVTADRFAPFEFTTPIDSVQCPTVNLCVANDNSGQVLTSTDPRKAGAWRVSWIPNQSLGVGYQILSCPSAELCVLGGSDGNLFVSTDPAAGAQSWKTVELGPNADAIAAVACSSSQACVAIGQSGDVFSSTDPAGGPGAWQESSVPVGAHPSVLSCPTTTFCALVGLDNFGSIYTSTDPLGRSAAWHKQVIDQTGSPRESPVRRLIYASSLTATMC